MIRIKKKSKKVKLNYKDFIDDFIRAILETVKLGYDVSIEIKSKHKNKKGKVFLKDKRK